MLKKKFALISLALLTTHSAFALNLQGYRFSDSYRYSLLDDSLRERFDGKYVFTASYGYVHSPFYYSDSNLEEVRDEIIKYNNVLTAGLSLYLTKNISLGIDLNAINNSVFDETYTRLADTVIKSRINLRRTKSFSLSLNPQVFIPTGSRENFSSMGSVSGALSAVAEQKLGRLHLLASVGALSSKNNAYVDVDHRQLLLAQLGASFDVSDKINVNFETFRNVPLVDDKLQDEGRYYLTAKHKTHERFSTYGGAGVTGVDEVERNTYSFFVGIKIHEAPEKIKPSPAPAVVQRQEAPIPFKEVYFPNNSYELDEQELTKLEAVFRYFHEKSDLPNLVIEGYASKIGTDAYNMILSQKRARTVVKYFINNGYPGDQISGQGHGERAAQDVLEYKNRKVQFSIKK